MGASSTSDRRPLAGALVAGLAALVWTAVVLAGWTEGWDRALMARAGEWRAHWPSLVDASWFASRAGDGLTRILFAAAVGAGLWWRGRWPAALWLLATVAGGMALSSLVKRLIDRPRPDMLDRLDTISNASYPSGHAMGAAVLALALALLAPRRPVFAVAGLYVAAVSASRLLLGVHWPSDLVGGLLMGLCWVLTLWWLVARR